ncbi:SRPBCC family protein [Nocardioides sp. NPDC058538]|uniref:SRPBCC family protein n=1 Tax=Nocardioides sp. NPDC058538 TaxID=3346542 RepID=UPI003664C750
MNKALKQGETVAASAVVRADPQRAYDVISDVRRIPEWSPECIRVERLDDVRFRGHNRRRSGRWTTTARIVAADPGREFGFVVGLVGRDFTRWTYRLEPHPDGCQVIEEIEMCMDLPFLALLFERVALRVKDRRTDLKGNLDSSLRRLRTIIEAEHDTGSGTDSPAPRETE